MSKLRQHQPGATGRRGGTVGFFLLLYNLFTQPRILLGLALEPWSRALLRTMLVILICASANWLFRVKPTIEAAAAWAAWFEARTEQVAITDGKLEWQQPETTPATFWHGSYRIDFLPESSSFSTPDSSTEGSHGVWIAPDQAYLWGRDHDNQVVKQTLWQDGLILGRLDPGSLLGQDQRLRPGEFVPRVRQWTWRVAVPMLWLVEFWRVLFVYFFYTLIFAAIPFILRGPMSAYGFAGVHSFYLHAGLPPLLIATVYNLLSLPWFDFSSLFVLGFLLYMGFVIWQTGRGLQLPPRPPK